MSDGNLGQILDGSAPSAAAEQPRAEAAPAQQQAAPTEQRAEPPQQQHDAQGQEDREVPLMALKAERQKRQELERQLIETRARAEALESVLPRQPKQVPQAPETPDEFYNNPAQYMHQEIEKARGMMRVEQSELLIRETKSDAAEVLEAFREMAQANPAVIVQMTGHQNPGKFAYDAGKIYMQTKGLGSPDELRAKIEQDVRAKVEAEFRQKYSVDAASNLTPTNAGARGSGGTSGQVPQGPRSLAEIFGR